MREACPAARDAALVRSPSRFQTPSALACAIGTRHQERVLGCAPLRAQSLESLPVGLDRNPDRKPKRELTDVLFGDPGAFSTGLDREDLEFLFG